MSEFTFLLYHQSDQIIEFLKSLRSDLLRNCLIDWVVEPFPLDTGGSIANAVSKLNLSDDFLVVNADTWIAGGITEMINTHSPSIGVTFQTNVSRYGRVIFDQNNIVSSFIEKTSEHNPGWINLGLCKLSPKLFNHWDGKPFSLEKDLMVSLVERSELSSLSLDYQFIDIGIPEDYYLFCKWVRSGSIKP